MEAKEAAVEWCGLSSNRTSFAIIKLSSAFQPEVSVSLWGNYLSWLIYYSFTHSAGITFCLKCFHSDKMYINKFIPSVLNIGC